ncbi:hypothetical protein [Sphingomonas sp.]|uniref:hypothetical protein n=1 Tax=Sphingomonas sp. TaxID=28214 RepID=UPI002E34B753|nr:hypothetical protein [Sphingomonas sp.]
MLPAATSILIRCQPSDSTTCSPNSSTATVSHGDSAAGSNASGSPAATGLAVARIVPGSRSARQISRASGRSVSGRSAKMQPPMD